MPVDETDWGKLSADERLSAGSLGSDALEIRWRGGQILFFCITYNYIQFKVLS